MKMKTIGSAVAVGLIAGALVLTPFKRAHAQVAPDTLGAKPVTELVKPYPVLSGFGLLPNPAARFRLGSFAYPFAIIPADGKSLFCFQGVSIAGKTGITATLVGDKITASIMRKQGPIVFALEAASCEKPLAALVYTIRLDSKMLAEAGAAYSLETNALTVAGEWRLALPSDWDITPSGKAVLQGGKISGGLGLQARKGIVRVSIGSDAKVLNADAQAFIAVPIGKKTLLLLPDVFVSIGKDGALEVDAGVTVPF